MGTLRIRAQYEFVTRSMEDVAYMAEAIPRELQKIADRIDATTGNRTSLQVDITDEPQLPRVMDKMIIYEDEGQYGYFPATDCVLDAVAREMGVGFKPECAKALAKEIKDLRKRARESQEEEQD